jgi:hypothetical protein
VTCLMDGYLRVQTDEDGKIVEIWDYWYKDEELELYMDSCGVDCYLEDYTFTPNSLNNFCAFWLMCT